MGLAKKLLLKPNMRIGVMNGPDGYHDLFDELPPGAELVAAGTESGPLDAVVLFVRSLAELEALAPKAMAQIPFDGLCWIAYPKKSSKIKTDIDRDTGWAKMSALGYAGVGLVAMNETWSAMRYRPAERVGS
jgi:hypothetical protein